MPTLPILKRYSALVVLGAMVVALLSLSGAQHAVEAQSRKSSPVGGYAPNSHTRPGSGSLQSSVTRDGQPLDLYDPWKPLQSGGLHDPDSYALELLQPPRQGMNKLPRAATGNFVDWVAALKQQKIEPRAEVEKKGEVTLDPTARDVILRRTGTMPTVTFSHAVHNEWLACKNCHDDLFPRKAGATKIKMIEIFKGQHCGTCHGKVAFPPDQCLRCHNGPRRSAQN